MKVYCSFYFASTLARLKGRFLPMCPETVQVYYCRGDHLSPSQSSYTGGVEGLEVVGFYPALGSQPALNCLWDAQC